VRRFNRMPILFAAALVLWPVMSAVAQEDGQIDGQIVNGTAGGAAPGGLAVTVHAFKDRAKVGERVVQTDSEGRFSVGDLEVGPGRVYFPIVEYGGASYFPERPIELNGGAAKTVIRVFEPVYSDAVIAFDRLNLLVADIGPTTLTLMQMGAVVNQSDRTYLGDNGSGDRGPALRFALPSGAIEIVPRAGLVAGDLATTDNGFVSSTPIPPGRHELAFSYVLPYDARSVQIAYEQSYPSAGVSLYVPDDGVTVSSKLLAARGTTDLGGRTFLHYTADELPSGAEIAFTLSGLPAAFRLRPSDLSLLVVGGGVLVLGTGLVASLRRGRSHSRTRPSASSVASDRSALVRSLAELDALFEAGGIDEAAYRAERHRRKNDLIALSAARPFPEAR
jgi:hypothetical protein